jgi:hypothetical protein
VTYNPHIQERELLRTSGIFSAAESIFFEIQLIIVGARAHSRGVLLADFSLTFGRSKMSYRALMAIRFLLSALNVITLGVTFCQQSRAATGGMSYQQLIGDRDFIRAVKSIAEACTVNVDIAKLKC